MPRRARRANRRPARKQRRRAAARKSSVPRALGLGSQMARIVETIEFNKLAPNNVQAMLFSLNQFQRARVLATNFRWYKPTKVTWTIEPQFNVFQSGAANPTVPYIYQVMNRTQDSTFMTINDLLTQGAKPKKLTGVVKLSYRPNWCSPGLIAQNVQPSQGFGGYLNNVVVAGLKSEYGWLQAPNTLPTGAPGALPEVTPWMAIPTTTANTAVRNQASGVYFNGHQVYIDQVVPGTALIPTYKVTCQVHWAFKDPKNILAGVTDNIFEDISGSYA